MSGPLSGIKVIEMAGIGPVPFAGMVLSDMGADVVRIDRPTATYAPNLMDRGRRSVGVDLRRPEGAELVLDLVAQADALIEGFRPGVMERLGLGPDVCLGRNRRLVYGRMTGFGQDGPLATAAGHDINYIALAGPLSMIGREGQPPTPPLNLVGDFGGGAMFLCFGVACGILEARSSGRGQVVDTAMVDGSALLATIFFELHRAWGPPGTNILDSGAPFYDVYRTADERWVAVGAVEPHFWSELLTRIGLDPADQPDQGDKTSWPDMKKRLAEVFATRTRDQWCEVLEGTDSCFAPVLELDELSDHPQHQARGTLVEEFGTLQPAPAPRFDRTPGRVAGPPPQRGQHTDEVLVGWGVAPERVAELREAGVTG
ncbi:MAG TPA: CaiB/BaiF CoA-transferase family protein [Acidimicrobiales bacterium]|nr:CaiB/BaiF CoA-transferase family protein [Acidimicrobiales bacterium]